MISEQDRNDLHNGLAQVLGDHRAAVLMEHLPPVGWADVARRSDIDALATATKRDVDALAVATKTDLAILTADFRTEMASLRTEMAGLGGELRKEMAAQTRTLVLAYVAAMVAVLGYVQIVLT